MHGLNYRKWTNDVFIRLGDPIVPDELQVVAVIEPAQFGLFIQLRRFVSESNSDQGTKSESDPKFA